MAFMYLNLIESSGDPSIVFNVIVAIRCRWCRCLAAFLDREARQKLPSTWNEETHNLLQH